LNIRFGVKCANNKTSNHTKKSIPIAFNRYFIGGLIKKDAVVDAAYAIVVRSRRQKQ
jgi:hypothetical protein